jgi:predicted nucleic acid-binding protein
MSETWIANASPVIALSKIERLDLLFVKGRTLLIPEAVVREVLRAPARDAARHALEAGWGSEPVAVRPDPEVLEWGLGSGESAVLSLARQRTAVAVVDDRAARVACKALGIRCLGTLGIILRARLDGRVSSSVELLKALQAAGFHLDDGVIRAALRMTTQERWPES